MSRREEHGALGGTRKAKVAGKTVGPRITRVIKGARVNVKHTPSSYLAEMRLTTEERLVQMKEAYPPKIIELLDLTTTSHQKDCSLDVDQALFQPFPSEIIFQQFEPPHTYEFPLALRNNDKVARHIKVTHEESPYFSVSCLRPAGSKVAPGMETTYIIAFTPDEKKDYDHELVCITEREKFVLPVKAIGSRALLDFPDEIHFSAAPVKYSSTKTILVRNVGDKEGKFQLETQPPFSVTPTTATLAVNTCMQIGVDFVPQKVGDHAAELVIHYDTGEDVYTQLYGSANDINIRLDRSSITLKDTFIGLSSQRSVTLHNRSDVVVHYQWKAFASQEEEEMQRELRSQQLSEEEMLSREAFYGRCIHNPSIRDRLPILTRSLSMTRKRYLDDERFLYFDEAISIDPVEGDIWPNSQAEISIVFQPEEATSYSRVAYCAVTGRESRLPLKIRGQGVGPQIQLSFDTLDIQNVFVNSSHAYEVILQNKGDIEGVYSLVPPSSLFGPKFSFAPSNGVLQPGRLQAIQISFCSSVLGEFSEDFHWKVEGAPNPLTLQIRGVVIGPTFQFDVARIKFGTISYGFLSSHEVTLTNTSEVLMTYHLRVPEDSSSKGKEFDIQPRSGTLPPNFHQTIRVNFTPLCVRSYSCALVVDVVEAGKEVFSLPITAKVMVPPVSLLTPLLDFGRCFIRHPYVQNVELQNNSELPVQYKMAPQDQVAATAVSYSTPHPEGIVKPLSTLSIPLQVEVLVQGEIAALAVFTILGSADPPLEVNIYCIGEGPVISVSPTQLSWGVWPVLTPSSKTVLLSNESLIPAEFECSFAREKTVFTVEPISSVISPGEKMELNVTALIDDCLKFTDKLTIFISYGVCFTVELSAEGRGTTIVSHPSLQPSVDLGPNFSRTPCQHQFTLTNRGRWVQALSWTTEGFSAAKLKKAEIEWSSRDTLDVAKKRSQRGPPDLKKPLFQIIPDKFVLQPYQSQVITLQGCSPIPQVVNERLLCHAIIGRNPHKERIIVVDVSARFIAPLLEFSTQEMHFTIQQPPGSKLTQHSQQLAVRNVSPLSVTALLLCEYPFSLLSGGTAHTQMEVSLVPGQDSTLVVQYDSTYCVNKHTRVEESQLTVAYKEHPQRDHVVLKSEVYFPNLQFETTEVDFGCILNDTETLHYVRMTNTSPLEVQYSWVFLHRPPVRRGDPDLQDEGVDMQSECETESLEGEESKEEEEREEREEDEVEEEGRREEEEEEREEENSEEQSSVSCCESAQSRQDVHEEESSQVEPEGLEQKREVMEPVLDFGGVKEEGPAQDKEEQSEGGKAVGTKRSKPPRQPWELVADPFTPISIEQVFDILPLHGTLLPGQSQQVQFTFYGHKGVATDVMAVCWVEGGPTYQVQLSGEASGVQYRFSRTHINMGQQLYDHVQSVEVVLYNTGKVGLDFCALGVTDSQELAPGYPTISPTMGHLPALENQKLTIHYLPGVPAEFKKILQVQVAHFEPDTITLTGEGVFPRISFNLPREVTSENYSRLRKKALKNLLPAGGLLPAGDRDAANEDSQEEITLFVPPPDLECEIERLMVVEVAQKHLDKMHGAGRKPSRPRVTLPAYQLDFGYVVYGLVVSHPLILTNVGHCPVSFTTFHRSLEGTGFSVDLGERVRSLPGEPEPEGIEFSVRFDPAAVQCAEGRVEATLPFNLVGGPTYVLKLLADVTRPSLELSSAHLDFGTVLCGQCRIITIRLHNPYHVKCEWTAITDKPPKKIPKHVPLHVRKKIREKPPPRYFEVEPSTGILLPGQRADIRVRFMPSEELHYVERIPFSICQNADSDLALHVEGQGSEPQVQFNCTLLEFPLVLPFSSGSEAEVIISNPMPYPVEIYSLTFDQQYIDEEEVLRWLKEYDKQNRLFLPPITPGGKLPQEILDAYEKDQKAKASTDKSVYPPEGEVPSEAVLESMVSGVSQVKLPPTSSTNLLQPRTPQPSTTALLSHPELSVIESVSALTQATGGSLSSHPDLIGAELPPVAAAIARYMGIDLSPEGALAEHRRGVAMVVHGPSKSGRSTQALALGKKYDATVLVMDDVLIDAISTASTPAGCKARECCIQAIQVEPAVQEPPSSLSVPSRKQFTTRDSSKEKDAHTESPTALPEQLHAFKVLPLEDSQFAVPEGELMPTVLPEDLIVEILSDRLQHMDCRKGVVFDGIESQFTSSPLISVAVILRAFHNRKHIYVVHISMELQAIQDRLNMIENEKQKKEEEEAARKKEAEEREQQRIAALLELDEDEYEALSEQQRAEVDKRRLEVWKEKREQKRREKERQEQLERERREEEERRLNEEKMRRKGKKDPKSKASVMKSVPAAVSRPPSVASTLQQPSQVLGGAAPTVSGASLLAGSETPSHIPKKRGTQKVTKPLTDEPSQECLLEKKYVHYKAMLEGLEVLLEDWNRCTGEAKPRLPPPEPEEHLQKAATPSRRKSRMKEDSSPQLTQLLPKEEEQEEESREGLGVPVILVEGDHLADIVTNEICSKGLPSAEEVLEEMGQGPGGPPLPGPVTLQVYPYPLRRKKLEHTAQERFVFIGTSPSDPNIPHDEPPKVPPEPQEDTHEPPHEKEPPSRLSKRTGSVHSMDSTDSDPVRRKSSHKSTAKKKNSLKTPSSPAPQLTVTQEEVPHSSSATELAKPSGPVKLVRFRWLVPAGGDTKLRLLFSSQDEGQFDQTLGFEIAGTRRRYQLFCRGLCVVPTICREPRIVFTSQKKTIKKGETVQKKFVLSEETFVFGPLLCGKTRERYREGRYPENTETLTISNTSLMEVESSFCFQHDHSANTFLVDPPTMTLQPGESKDLTVWAYPKSSGHIRDALVCCIRHNPDPVVFNMCCDGVEPELKVDKKVLEFKKVLLHRKQTNVLNLHNPTLLPVVWKLSGVESLGEEFSFSQDHGVVGPKSTLTIHVHFRAAKQVLYTKKAFKVEIADVDQIMGLMVTETVQIQAEAYDVALDVSFPRGIDGGLDFQCCRVYDEQKQVVQLKNKGKYDIGFHFVFDMMSDGSDYSRMFTVNPTHSTLYPGEKAQAINVTFRATREVSIKDLPILKCQVIDAHVGEEGDVIANIPIRITAKAVFSKFSISPVNDINFGVMVINTRHSSSFTLENKGEFEFKYAITKKLSAEQQKQRAVNMAAVTRRTKSREGKDISSPRSSFVGKQGGANRAKGEPSLRTEVLGGAQRLVLGMYTVTSAVGFIPAGQSQMITVECLTGDKPGRYEEELLVEISDRHKEAPAVTYKICGEVLMPGINTTDIAAIFEEHRVCQQLGALGQHQFHEEGCVGVYGEEERRFLFKSVVVGQTSKARFKISNPNKIPCDVQLGVKPISAKLKAVSEAFDVDPSTKIGIPAHAHIYATVTFRPMAMQSYSAVFEAIPDGTRGRGLSFELQGEGNLPQVAVIKPSLRNTRGLPLLLFRRLLVHQSQRLGVTLRNTGTMPATVHIETFSGGQYFTVCPPPEEVTISEEDTREEEEDGKEATFEVETAQPSKHASKHAPPVTVKLAAEEEKEFMVVFQPHVTKKCQGELRLRIVDNQFENVSVQLVGEGYEEEVCVGNIRGEAVPEEEGKQLTEEVEAARENHLHFGRFAVGETRQLIFALTNHSPSTAVRFQWPSLPNLTFTPSTGHLHPSTSKDITVTFKASRPQSLTAQRVFGKLWKITFSQPLSQIPDWDDRMKTVRWVNVPQNQVPPVADEGSSTSPAPLHKHPPSTPAKKKVVETEPEPSHSTLEERHRDLELFASAVTDFAKYECPVREVPFRDTLMYQTRTYSFPLRNTGQIPLSYWWEPLDSPLTPHPSQLHLDDSGNIMSEGGEVMPFAIAPTSGQLPPGGEQNISLQFSPLDVTSTKCTFRCNIPHLDNACSPLEVVVHGSSLMPYCHFDLEQSDYLTRRAMREGKGGAFGDGRAVSDPSSTRVIEFHSCGVGIRIVRRFQIINPTSTGYEFSWNNEGGLPSTVTSPPFKCLTPKGFVAGGKKYEMEFEYLPTALDVVESLWRFSIPSLSLSLSFLLVGHTVEPAVHLDRAYVSFKSMLLGSKASETVYLLNNESSPFRFDFVEQSCHCTGHSAQLHVSPMKGTIPPNGKLPVDISFTATQEGDCNFNLQCKVSRKPSPLVLNVKAEGYAISTSLSYTTPEGQEESLPVGQRAKRVIDFGQVTVNERALGQVSILNHGQYRFEYKWVLLEKKGGREQWQLGITPKAGAVEPYDRARCELSFSPTAKTVLRGCELVLEISNGPSFPIKLRGSGVEPQVDFSFTEYNFGPCFLHRVDMPAKQATLTITNKDSRDVSVTCLFTNNPSLSMQFESKLLPPEGTADVLVEFRPKELAVFHEQVVFEINGLCKKTVSIRGEGVPMKIELANPAQKVVSFGAPLAIGESCTRTVKVVNHSPIPISLSVSILPSSSVPALQEEGVLTVSPTGEVMINSNGGDFPISVTFSPKVRVPQFSEEVTLECLGTSCPLFMVAGSCHGLEVTLDSNHVPFGAVVQNSQSTRRILMINTGEIGTGFCWEKERFAPDFSIAPVEGYISPGMEVPFDVTFHPHKLNPDIRYEALPCKIEKSPSPLMITLTLSGMCIEQTPHKEVLHFTTLVRSKESRHLTIHNKTSSLWFLRPAIDGEYWSGPENLRVEPGQARHYDLTYHPLTMTTESQKHQGSIFFPLPDGSGLLYNLLGTAEPPKPAGSISREIPCKTDYTEMLPVKNWLRRSQRFHVYRDIIRPEKLDRSVSLHGADYIDVPAQGRREYKLHFHSYKEFSIVAKVTFRNEQTGEYLFYNVAFKSTPPGIMSTIELKTPVRQSISHCLTIANPLPNTVTMTTSTNVPDIILPPSFIVGAQSDQGNCTFEYLPLKAGEMTGKLTLNSSELGVYQYELHLVATPPLPERPVHFTTSLGNSQQRHCPFKSYARGKTEYTCKVDSNDFHVEKTITVASAGNCGTEASVEVTFEPSHLGDTHSTLTISSPSGGDYTIPLHGHCLVPNPQGPFTVKAGSSISIPFRNAFPQTMQFSFSVDNPVFVVKASDYLKPRKMYNILVSYDAKQADPTVTKVGKLVVTSQHSARPRTPGGISWVYYLKGIAQSH